MKILLQTIALGFLVTTVWAHDGDHNAPGAIPFAPHGGKAVEASGPESEHEHEEEKEEEHEHEKGEPSLEFFFEATYRNGQLSVYPLALDESNPKEFILSRAEGTISNLRVTIEFPRSKKSEAIAMKLLVDEKVGDHWVGDVPANKDIRFFANIQANWNGIERKSRIHLEKRK